MNLFVDARRSAFDPSHCRALGLDVRTVHAVERVRRQLCGAIGVADTVRASVDDEVVRRCTLVGFPDRVVRRRAPGTARGVMVGGMGVMLAAGSVVREAELFVAIDVDAAPQRVRAEALVRMASAVEHEWLAELFPGAVAQHEALVFDAARRRVVRRTQRRYEDLVLSEQVHVDVDRLAAGEILAELARTGPDSFVPPTAADEALLSRIRFLQQWMPELGFPADASALRSEALAVLCAGCVTLAEVEAKDLVAHLRHSLTGPQRRALEQDAPTDYLLPSGRRVPVRYETGRPPAVAARIQELFGLTSTPRLAGGRVPLLIEMLAPSQRPVQITDDLESFWRRTYPEVRKQLRGRYPKHHWPEDPFTATPTSRVGTRR
jgi:ATP-dependent helicase HrpB